MNVTDEWVRHRQFGTGRIVGQSATTVTVEFCKGSGRKKFLYPSAFESFLELCDPASKAEMDAELSQMKEQAAEVKRQREEENEKRREDTRRALLEHRLAAKKRSSAKKVGDRS